MAGTTKRDDQAASSKRAPGRPEKPESEVKRHHLNLNLDEDQKKLIERAARADDDKPHNWGRRMLLRLARERLKLPEPGIDVHGKKLE